RIAPDEFALRLGNHVHRRRSGDRDDRGARLMAAYERVMVEIDGGIGTLTLNRPEKLNAFDRELCRELVEALELLAKRQAVRVVVITGAGPGCSPGCGA